MWEVLRKSAGDLSGLVVFANQRHDLLSERVALLREGYGHKTWPSKAGAVQDALNLFFTPVPKTDIPTVFVDRVAGRLLVKAACEDAGARTQRLGGGKGYAVSIPTRERAVWLDDRLHIGRALCDIHAEHTGRTDANPFVRNGWSPALQAQVDAAARVARAKANGKGEDVKRDTGRYFVMHLPPYVLPTIEDPHLHDRLERAIARHTDSPGFRRGWQTKHDLWSRGDEAFSMTMRSFHLGALEMGERRFCRLVIIKDKPTGDELVKPAAFSPKHGKLILGKYFNVERRAQDPKGWGLEDHEKACWEGDDEALDTPVFYTLAGTGLTAETARKMFGRVVRKANIKCGERYAWMHLGRHDRIEKALDDIEAMDVSEAVKQVLREEVASYVGWRDERWLKVYGRKHHARRDATKRIDFATRHAWVAGKGPLPPQPVAPARPVELDVIFGGR